MSVYRKSFVKINVCLQCAPINHSIKGDSCSFYLQMVLYDKLWPMNLTSKYDKAHVATIKFHKEYDNIGFFYIYILYSYFINTFKLFTSLKKR